MKTRLLLFLALAALAPAHAEVFRPGLRRHAAWAPRTEVVVSYGHHEGRRHHHSGWRGGSGLYLGATFSDRHYYGLHRSHWGHRPSWRRPYLGPGYIRTVPARYSDYGYGYDTGYSYERPSRATSGLWLGALTGAIIGNNSGSLGHDAWRGALYGAGAGLIIGAVADNHARQREAAAERAANVQQEISAAALPAASTQPVTIINHYHNSPAATPMSSANALFGRN